MKKLLLVQLFLILSLVSFIHIPINTVTKIIRSEDDWGFGRKPRISYIKTDDNEKLIMSCGENPDGTVICRWPDGTVFMDGNRIYFNQLQDEYNKQEQTKIKK